VRIVDVPDGFDVRPEQLGRGAADLRADADSLDDAGLQIGAAFDEVAAGAGVGPLGGAASELGSQLDRALQAIRASLADCARALEASAAQYVSTDGRAASRLEGPR
jgi:hypothetical protein